MPLTPEQRLDRLEARIRELRPWTARAWLELGDWTWDGEALALGERWPDRRSVRTLRHGEVAAPAGWAAGECRLELDLGGEGRARLRYSDGAEASFGVDVNHRSWPVGDAPFSIEVAIVARSPFGVPNREARLERARLVWADPEVIAFVRRLELVAEAGRTLGGHDALEPLLAAAERALTGLDWPTATLPYLARRAPEADMLRIWELPQDLDSGPPGLDASPERPWPRRPPGSTTTCSLCASATRPRAPCASPGTPTSTSRGCGPLPRHGARRSGRSPLRSVCSSAFRR